MKPHSEGETRDVTSHLQPLVDDDAYLTALSEGKDLSSGQDELSSLLLELRGEVETDVPAAPVVSEFIGAFTTPEAEGKATRRNKRGPGPWLSGLIGAAAATVIVASAGSALYNASPGSPLWGPAKAVFGDRTAVIELASTLEQLEAANESGDVNAARRLLSQARGLLDSMGVTRTSNTPGTTQTHAPVQSGATGETVTVTVTETAAPPSAEGSATAEPTPQDHTTEPAVPAVTQTVTVTAPRPTQAPQPSTSWAPSPQPDPSPSSQPSLPANDDSERNRDGIKLTPGN